MHYKCQSLHNVEIGHYTEEEEERMLGARHGHR